MLLFSTIVQDFIDVQVLMANKLDKVLWEIFKIILSTTKIIINQRRIYKVLYFSLDFYTKCSVFLQPVDYLQHNIMDLIQIIYDIHAFILNEYFMDILTNYCYNCLLFLQAQQCINFYCFNEIVQSYCCSILVIFNQSWDQCHELLIKQDRGFICTFWL